MRREKLEHLVTTRMIEGKQQQKMMDGLTKWLKVGRMTEALKARRDRDVWKVMIAYAKEHGTCLIEEVEIGSYLTSLSSPVCTRREESGTNFTSVTWRGKVLYQFESG